MDHARFDAVVKRLETGGTSRRADERGRRQSANAGAATASAAPSGAAAKRRKK